MLYKAYCSKSCTVHYNMSRYNTDLDITQSYLGSKMVIFQSSILNNLFILKQCFLRKTMSPQPSSFVGYIENYGIKLWRPFKQQYSMGRNGYGPEWSWTEMVMGRNNPEPLYNMSRNMRKQTLCICENKDAKPISVFVFAKWIVQSLYFLNLEF